MSTARTLIVLSKKHKAVLYKVFRILQVLTVSLILYSIHVLLLKPYFSV